MKCIAGLGNPGPQYEQTRHNAGFLVLDKIAADAQTSRFQVKFSSLCAQADAEGQRVLFIKPMTYMNASGDAVAQALNFYKIDVEDLIVIHDEVDLPFGQIKIKVGGGTAGHNGLRSISARIGSDSYTRIRCGVGKDNRRDTASYVLSTFAKEELAELPLMIERAAAAVQAILRLGPLKAMTEYNKKTVQEQPL